MKKYYYGQPDGYALLYRKGRKKVYAQWYDMRIARESVPEGKHMYQCADYDGTGIICRIQPSVMVDFFGTIVTDAPLVFDGTSDDPESQKMILEEDDFLCWIDREEYDLREDAG